MKSIFLTDKDGREIDEKIKNVESKIQGAQNVTLNETSEGVEISNGKETVLVRHGKKGDKGDKGDKGNKGDKGDKPVAGVDYYTAAEKQAFVSDVIAALPIYRGEVEGV